MTNIAPRRRALLIRFDCTYRVCGFEGIIMN